MQLPFFYQTELPNGQENFDLSPDTSKHVAQVLRMKSGEDLILTDGKGIELTAKIVFPDKKKTTVSFVSRRNLLSNGSLTAIGVALLKNDNRFEWFIEKATELGVRNIFPLMTARTEKKTFRRPRLESIMISAMLQSRQYFLPTLTDPVTLNYVYDLKDYEQKMIAHCMDDAGKVEMRDVVTNNSSRIVLIGPEGDFSEEEVADSLKNGFITVSLGTNRLRTETAAVKAAVYITD